MTYPAARHVALLKAASVTHILLILTRWLHWLAIQLKVAEHFYLRHQVVHR